MADRNGRLCDGNCNVNLLKAFRNDIYRRYRTYITSLDVDNDVIIKLIIKLTTCPKKDVALSWLDDYNVKYTRDSNAGVMRCRVGGNAKEGTVYSKRRRIIGSRYIDIYSNNVFIRHKSIFEIKKALDLIGAWKDCRKAVLKKSASTCGDKAEVRSMLYFVRVIENKYKEISCNEADFIVRKRYSEVMA